MANYFCTNSVEEQVDYLTDKLKECKDYYEKLDQILKMAQVKIL